jgi:hypothetical protein
VPQTNALENKCVDTSTLPSKSSSRQSSVLCSLRDVNYV